MGVRIYLALATLLMAGCDPNSTLEGYEIRQANAICEAHEGVDRIEMDSFITTTKSVHCNDGASWYQGKKIDPPSDEK